MDFVLDEKEAVPPDNLLLGVLVLVMATYVLHQAEGPIPCSRGGRQAETAYLVANAEDAPKAKPSEQTLLLSQLSDLDLICFVLRIVSARELRGARNEKRFDSSKPDTNKLRVSRTLL